MVLVRREGVMSDCLPAGLFVSGVALILHGIAFTLPGWVRSVNYGANQFSGFWMYCANGWDSCIGMWEVLDGGNLTSTAWAILLLEAVGLIILLLATGFGCMGLVGRKGGLAGKIGFIVCNIVAGICILIGVIICGVEYDDVTAIGHFMTVSGTRRLYYSFVLAVISLTLCFVAAFISICHKPRDYGTRRTVIKRKYNKLSEQFYDKREPLSAYTYHVRISPDELVNNNQHVIQPAILPAIQPARQALPPVTTVSPPTVRIVATPSTTGMLANGNVSHISSTVGVKAVDRNGMERKSEIIYQPYNDTFIRPY